MYAYIVAQLTEHVIKAAGNDLPRAHLLKRSVSLKDVRFGMMLPGIGLNNNPADYNAVNAMQVIRFNGKELAPVGDVIKVK